jgi:OFA family oxalate/formate antiporter-like MFS transporter
MSAVAPAISPGNPAVHSTSHRWVQLFIGIVCMAAIANMQYGWTLFVDPIAHKYGWSKASIQIAFTIFIVAETWLGPVEGYLVDRFGPRPVVMIGGILCGLGWTLNSMADSLPYLYTAAAISGIGAGAVYGTCVGNAMKWFGDRRGLAVGLTAAGFGMGSAATVRPIAVMITGSGYESAFLWFGLAQGLVVVVAALALSDSRKAGSRRARQMRSVIVPQSRREFTPFQVLVQPTFWLLYVTFVLVAAGGLMATAQLSPIARDFKVADIPVDLVGLSWPALTFALSLDRIFNGVTRPFFGWISDNIGRERTMLIAFSLEALGILMLFYFGADPVAFVILSGLVFFAWGEIYSLFPSTTTDSFGTKYATTNAGMMYTAKGTAALLVPFSSMLTEATGSWHAVFIVACGMNVLAALMAWFVVRPVREAHIARANAAVREAAQ